MKIRLHPECDSMRSTIKGDDGLSQNGHVMKLKTNMLAGKCHVEGQQDETTYKEQALILQRLPTEPAIELSIAHRDAVRCEGHQSTRSARSVSHRREDLLLVMGGI